MADPLALDGASSAALAAHWCGGDPAAAHLLLGRAARGDVEAQRLLAQGLADIALAYPDGADESLAGSEIFARMAASHGAPADRRRLAGLLSFQAAHDRASARHESATELEAECLVLLNMLADEGFEEAADAVSTFALSFSAEAVASACAETAERQAVVVNIAPAPLADPAPPPLERSAEGEPLSRWDRWKDRGWSVRFYLEDVWFALCQLGRALIGRG